eukprot:Skav220880  [mRNA]  locus=scaffold2625:45878:59814:+ [translate_table: standard]
MTHHGQAKSNERDNTYIVHVSQSSDPPAKAVFVLGQSDRRCAHSILEDPNSEEAHQIQKGQIAWEGTISETMKLAVAYLGNQQPPKNINKLKKLRKQLPNGSANTEEGEEVVWVEQRNLKVGYYMVTVSDMDEGIEYYLRIHFNPESECSSWHMPKGIESALGYTQFEVEEDEYEEEEEEEDLEDDNEEDNDWEYRLATPRAKEARNAKSEYEEDERPGGANHMLRLVQGYVYKSIREENLASYREIRTMLDNNPGVLAGRCVVSVLLLFFEIRPWDAAAETVTYRYQAGEAVVFDGKLSHRTQPFRIQSFANRDEVPLRVLASMSFALIDKRRNFAQIEDFKKKGGKSVKGLEHERIEAYTKLIEKA